MVVEKNTAVEQKVREIVTRIVRKPESDFTPKSTFKDFNADSLDIVQILVAVEDAFDVEIQDEELQGITDMGGFVSLIERKIAQKE